MQLIQYLLSHTALTVKPTTDDVNSSGQVSQRVDSGFAVVALDLQVTQLSAQPEIKHETLTEIT